ncbi:DMT family transporter [Chromobacterium sp. CV08]|uniref:DMT family transporter n=1 Tax=Chromobacterium sp. CV08 TaxID=3133274 RepID=UPI003DA994F1
MHSKRSTLDYLLLLGVGMVWGGQFLFNAKAVEYFPPITVAAGRVLIGALTLSLLSLFIPEKTPEPSQRSTISIGLLFAGVAVLEAVLPLFLIVWGQQHVDSSVTAVLIGSVPILTLIFSAFLSKNSKFSINSAMSVVLGFIGIVILVNPNTSGLNADTLIYEIAIFAGAVSFALSLILFEKLPHGTPIRTARIILSVASVPLLVASLLLDKPWTLNWAIGGIVALMVLGIAGSALAYLLYATLVQRTGPVFTSISNFIVPMVGVILGVLVRGEQFGTKEWLALACIIAALAVNEIKTLIKPKLV